MSTRGLQAARFRLYGFAEDGEVVCELNKSNGFDLNWKMEVGNQKAAWYELVGELFRTHTPDPLANSAIWQVDMRSWPGSLAALNFVTLRFKPM